MEYIFYKMKEGEDMGEGDYGQEIKKHPGGRPSKYDPSYCKQAYKLCLLGATDKELADFFGVEEKTVNNWKEEYPEFLQSLREGKDEADANVAKKLYHRALGYVAPETKIVSYEGAITDKIDVEKHYPPDPTAAIFWLKNRNPARWRDRVEQKVVVSDDFDELMASDDES